MEGLFRVAVEIYNKLKQALVILESSFKPGGVACTRRVLVLEMGRPPVPAQQ